jgi:hypothetical protein
MSNPADRNAITQSASGIPKYAPGFIFLREGLFASAVIRIIPDPTGLSEGDVSCVLACPDSTSGILAANNPL